MTPEEKITRARAHDRQGRDLLDLARELDREAMLETGLQFHSFGGGSVLGLGEPLDPPESLDDWQMKMLREERA